MRMVQTDSSVPETGGRRNAQMGAPPDPLPQPPGEGGVSAYSGPPSVATDRGRRRPVVARRPACPCQPSQVAMSFAWYVMMRSAPARLMPVMASSTARCSSSQPLAAAALIIAYSPLTL